MDISTVYEKYKHLDFLMADPEWCGANPQMLVLHECWMAIREANQQIAKGCKTTHGEGAHKTF